MVMILITASRQYSRENYSNETYNDFTWSVMDLNKECHLQREEKKFENPMEWRGDVFEAISFRPQTSKGTFGHCNLDLTTNWTFSRRWSEFVYNWWLFSLDLQKKLSTFTSNSQLTGHFSSDSTSIESLFSQICSNITVFVKSLSKIERNAARFWISLPYKTIDFYWSWPLWSDQSISQLIVFADGFPMGSSHFVSFAFVYSYWMIWWPEEFNFFQKHYFRWFR